MTAARISGGIFGLVALLLLAVVIIISFTHEDMVAPEVSVVGSDGEGSSSGVVAAEALIRRTNLMGDRDAPEKTRGVSVQTNGDGAAQLDFRPGVGAPRKLTEAWATVGDNEEALLPQSENIQGISSLPYENAGRFEQPGGRTWRYLHNVQARYGGGWILFGMLAALGLFLFARGRIKVAEGLSGKTIERFNSIERANHWMTSSSFVLMALTGLILLYGKPVLIPLFGEPFFGEVAEVSAWLHMASAVPFVIGLCIMIVLWLIDNLPTALDWEWLKRGGGFLHDDGNNPPARKFNAGQKIVFWGVTIGGLLMLATGLVMMFPFTVTGYDGMQAAQLAHAVIGILLIALIFGHIYIGTIGMVGAFSAMWSGQVDRNWAREHHSIWYRKKTGDPDVPAGPESGR